MPSSGGRCSAASGDRRWAARSSTPSAMCSCATSPTARSRAPSGPTSTAGPPQWIESLSADRENAPDMLAHHYSQALEFARDSGRPTDELERRTRLALREAAERATALNSITPAQRHYVAALALWPEDDPEWPDARRRGRRHRFQLKRRGYDRAAPAGVRTARGLGRFCQRRQGGDAGDVPPLERGGDRARNRCLRALTRPAPEHRALTKRCLRHEQARGQRSAAGRLRGCDRAVRGARLQSPTTTDSRESAPTC